MTPSLAQAILAVSGSIGASIVVKATLVMAVALLVLRYAAGAVRASVRHAILASAFVGLLILPGAVLLMPRTVIVIPIVRASQEAAPLAAPVVPRAGAGGSSADVGTTVTAQPRAAGRVSPRPAVSVLLRATWFIGVLVFLAALVVPLWRLRNVRRRGSPWRAGDGLVRELAIRAGVRRSVTVLLHEGAIVPVTYGVMKPVVLLPPDVQSWSDREIQHAITHELEHVRRGDWMVTLLSRGVCALYWFHPLAWMSLRALSLESERACDDAVVREADHAAYADHLLRLAERLTNGIAHPVLSMASRSQLATRIEAILNRAQRRGRSNLAVAAVIAATACAFVLALAPLAAVARVPDGPVSVKTVRLIPDAPSPTAAAQAVPAGPSIRPADDHVIRPNETLSITVFDGRTVPRSVYRVDETGIVTLPLIGPMEAAGKTVSQFMDDLAKRLASATPKVEAGSDLGVVSVTGAVRAPQTIQMQGSLTLLDALVMAGSPRPDAGDEVRIERKSGLNVVFVKMVDLKLGAANTVLQDGDTVIVSSAQHYTFGGEVRNPGAYVWTSGLTVEEGIARAGGLNERGSLAMILVRRRVGGTAVLLPVTLQDEIQPDDVISTARRKF